MIGKNKLFWALPLLLLMVSPVMGGTYLHSGNIFIPLGTVFQPYDMTTATQECSAHFPAHPLATVFWVNVYSPYPTVRTITNGGSTIIEGDTTARSSISCGGIDAIYSDYYIVGDGLPIVDFEASPLTGPVPHEVTLTSTATVPEYSSVIFDYDWQVTKPDGTILLPNVLGHNSTATFTANQLGYYSVIHLAQNSWGADEKDKDLYISAGLLPNVTPTPTPTPVPVRTYTTIAPVQTLSQAGITIINKTDYKNAITSTILGNFTSGYTNVVDSLGNTIDNFGVNVTSIVLIPFGYITPNIKTAAGEFKNVTTPLIVTSSMLTMAIGILLGSLPEILISIITVVLVCDIALMILRGKFGNG